MLTDEIFALYTKCQEELASISEALDAKYLGIELEEANYGHIGDLIEIGNKLEEIQKFMQ